MKGLGAVTGNQPGEAKITKQQENDQFSNRTTAARCC
jgi:hypothetical protein